MTDVRSFLKCVCMAGLMAVPPLWAQGQATDAMAKVGQTGSGALSLQQALMIALERNPKLQISATNVTSNEGSLQSAGGTFDPLLRADASMTETHDTARTSSSSLAVAQRLRSGMVLDTTLSGQTQDAFDGPPAFSTASVGINITFPLLRGRGEEYAAAAETAARLVLEQSQYDLRHATSAQIFSTAAAYWNLRAAEEALLAQKEAEARAEQMVLDIRRLIEADERPAADISIISANLTNKRTARIAAEQTLIRARMALGAELGLEYTDLAGIERAVDPFPAFNAESALIENIPPLVNTGLERRLDLKAANTYLDALKVSVNSARDNLKPILDFKVGVGHGGRTSGQNPLQVFTRNDGAAQVTAGVSYTWDVRNNTSEGRLLSQSAVYDQQSISIRALRLSIGTGIENAVAVYNRAARQLAESQYTVELYTKIVEDEKTKLRMGGATLLDVVNVESQRQEAVISNIAQHLAYANAIAALRFELGELVGDQAQTQVLPIDRLLFVDNLIGSAP